MPETKAHEPAARAAPDVRLAESEEDRLLRTWTPVILRTILIASALILIAGLLMAALQSPNYFVDQFHSVQGGRALHARESLSALWSGALRGSPHAIMTLGLIVLTLVPLGRVAFCFLLFAKEKDGAYVAFTAYVLAGLIAGVMLGRIG
jgi:uncharacterized membrane protein